MSEHFVDRNASASANGWFFQISAGMFLFLRDIKNNKDLKIEGKSEDIEIETESGLVYAQAKSIYDVNARSSVYSDYKKALNSLKALSLIRRDFSCHQLFISSVMRYDDVLGIDAGSIMNFDGLKAFDPISLFDEK